MNDVTNNTSKCFKYSIFIRVVSLYDSPAPQEQLICRKRGTDMSTSSNRGPRKPAKTDATIQHSTPINVEAAMSPPFLYSKFLRFQSNKTSITLLLISDKYPALAAAKYRNAGAKIRINSLSAMHKAELFCSEEAK